MSEIEINTQYQKRKISKLAIASLILPVVLFMGGILSEIFIARLKLELELVGITLIIIAAPAGLILSVIALVLIRRSKGALSGKGFAIGGIIISVILLLLLASVVCISCYVLCYETPYDDSNPKAIVAKIENNCGFKFPAKIESLKAADKFAGGIDRPYVFVINFTTDKTGFVELRDSFSQIGGWSEEITLKEGDNIRDKSGSWSRNAPQWCSEKIPRGKTYESFLLCKNDIGLLDTIFVEVANSGEVVVYMYGWGDSRQKEKKNDLKLK
ncbi:MAG: DUF4190 domain-containing protein [Phycisphaerae bacterium]|nr:DUF4190 domain-containing protein [Phycisphaerae bacterium]MDD5380143.1 DUF4190 domain-containing protein [Phycisphaerae bacterium]